MSDVREEAAVAREALVRGKKKQKKQTTLMTKWNIVLDFGESGVSMATAQPRVYYTCMDYWMQLRLLPDLLHLRYVVNGNLEFISVGRVVSILLRSERAWKTVV